MRAEPEAWSARVITARPPAFSTQAAITSESVAITTGPISAACARRMTWTIIGSPAISASGLPGSLVEAMRAGMTTRIILCRARVRQDRQNASWVGRLYGLPGARQTGYLCAARGQVHAACAIQASRGGRWAELLSTSFPEP